MKNQFSNQLWFKDKFQDKLSCRYITQFIALNMLNQFSNNPLIVETGTIRMENDWGAGMSTLVFGEYIKHYNGKIITIDNSFENMEVCKKVTKDYSNSITYIVEDSLKYLSTIIIPIDLLYLDSMDCPIEGDASEAQSHNLKEFLICEPLLHSNSIIMIDDVGFPNGGKAAKTHEYLFDNNYLLIMKNQQSVWIKK